MKYRTKTKQRDRQQNLKLKAPCLSWLLIKVFLTLEAARFHIAFPLMILMERNNWLAKGSKEYFLLTPFIQIKGQKSRVKIQNEILDIFPGKIYFLQRWNCQRRENCGNDCGEDLEGRQVHQWVGGERCEKMFYSCPLPSLLHVHIFLHVHPPAAYLLCTFSRHPPRVVG